MTPQALAKEFCQKLSAIEQPNYYNSLNKANKHLILLTPLLTESYCLMSAEQINALKAVLQFLEDEDMAACNDFKQDMRKLLDSNHIEYLSNDPNLEPLDVFYKAVNKVAKEVMSSST